MGSVKLLKMQRHKELTRASSSSAAPGSCPAPACPVCQQQVSGEAGRAARVPAPGRARAVGTDAPSQVTPPEPPPWTLPGSCWVSSLLQTHRLPAPASPSPPKPPWGEGGPHPGIARRAGTPSLRWRGSGGAVGRQELALGRWEGKGRLRDVCHQPRGCHPGDKRGAGTASWGPACPNALSDRPHPCPHSSRSQRLRLSLATPPWLPPDLSWCEPVAQEHRDGAGYQHPWSIPGASLEPGAPAVGGSCSLENSSP